MVDLENEEIVIKAEKAPPKATDGDDVEESSQDETPAEKQE